MKLNRRNMNFGSKNNNKNALCGEKKTRCCCLNRKFFMFRGVKHLFWHLYFSHVSFGSLFVYRLFHTPMCWCWHSCTYCMRSINVQMEHRTVVGFWHMNELDLMANIYRWQFHFGFCAWVLVLFPCYCCACVGLRCLTLNWWPVVLCALHYGMFWWLWAPIFHFKFDLVFGCSEIRISNEAK